MSRQKLIIISAGKLGREVHNWSLQAAQAGAPWEVKGFLDDRGHALDDFPGRPPILGTADEYCIQPDDVFLCAVAEPKLKQRYQELVEQRGGQFITLIHPSALVGLNTQIGAGSIICPFCQVSCDVRMGRGVFFGTNSNTAHDTEYGDFCQISGSCEINGNAILGRGVFLGSHATILPQTRLGDWSYVGAHSVVLRRVGPFQKVFGVPAVGIGTTTWPSAEDTP
jgi:sugar O-acyltransferase (sialic acid O-acetyltransferase NeuD family)